MIYQAKHIISLRDHVDSVNIMHIKFPEQVDITVELAENNELWGSNPEGSKILVERQLLDFFDKNGDFVFSKRIAEPAAVYFELEKGFELHDLLFKDSGLLKNIFLSEEDRLIYAFYMSGSESFVIQGSKVKSTYIESLISNSPTDARIRHILFERCKLDTSKPVYSPDDMLTVEEVAEFLKMTKGTFQNKLSKGEILDPVQIGGSNRWKFGDLVDWVNDLRP